MFFCKIQTSCEVGRNQSKPPESVTARAPLSPSIIAPTVVVTSGFCVVDVVLTLQTRIHDEYKLNSVQPIWKRIRQIACLWNQVPLLNSVDGMIFWNSMNIAIVTSFLKINHLLAIETCQDTCWILQLLEATRRNTGMQMDYFLWTYCTWIFLCSICGAPSLYILSTLCISGVVIHFTWKRTSSVGD